VQTGFHRPNLAFRVTPCAPDTRDSLLLERLRSAPEDPAIVYVTLQHTAETVAATLRQAGVHALAYHAGLPDDHRADVQDRFMRGEVPVVVATIAFGMGIDKSDLRAVYHYNLPKSLESYLQESGRAGRDGRDATCEIFLCPGDRVPLENFAYGDTPSPLAVRALVEHLLLQGERFSVSRYDLSVTNDIRPLVIATALTELELEGILIPEGPFYAGYRIKPARPLEKILAGFSPSRQEFLRRLFAAGKAGRTWITLDVAEAAIRIGEPEDRIRRALGHLEDLGDVDLEATGLRHAYRLNPDVPRNVGEIAERLRRRFEERERGEIARLELVVAYGRAPGCKARHLVAHFGDALEADCGRCSGCLGPAPGTAGLDPEPEPEPEPGFTERDLETIRRLRSEKHPALRQPRQLARFLCGLTSPATTRDRLTRHDAFGALEHLPFPLVLSQVE
jgi:ATP-dependent DNA helicase RecQ